MKTLRQETILDVIQSRDIETQEELAEALRQRGIKVTQATVSRDIKEMRLIKVMTPSGVSKYATPYQPGGEKEDRGHNERLIRILEASLIGAECAGHTVVIKTLSGSASVAGEALDNLGWQEVLGTIAGDNTIFMIARTAEDASEVTRRVREMIK